MVGDERRGAKHKLSAVPWLWPSAIVAGGFLASKALGLLREILIARTFGARGDLDAFFAATQFSDLLFAVIAGGSLASVFIPVFSGYLARDATALRAGWQFASAVINAVFLVVALFALGTLILAQPITEHWLAPGFAPAQRTLTAELLRLVLVSTIIFSVSGMFTGILHAHNRFVLPALAPALYNLGIIAGVLYLAPAFGVFGLAYGVVAGSALHLAIQLPGLWRCGAQYTLTLGGHTAGMRRLLVLLGPRIVTMLGVRATWIVMTNLASRLDEGSIAALGYAYAIWQLPETLIGTAIALAVFPRLSAQFAAQQSAALRATYRSALAAILGLAIPATLALIAFAQPIVALFLQRGAFDATATARVAVVLQWYALAVVGEALLELTARIFYARQNSVTPMIVALGAMTVRVGLMLAWHASLGAAGLALAYAIGVLLEGIVLGWLGKIAADG